MKESFGGHIRHFLRPDLPDLLLYVCVGLPESALVDESGVFPCRHHSTMVRHGGE
jgi:hypothetical protein